MKVLLMKDVYNLGRAGEVKKVANGFGRNFLIPQKLAMLATPGALKQVDRIKAEADVRRNVLNEELTSVAEELVGIQLTFPAKAGETGKLYGSVTNKMIAVALSEKLKLELGKRQIDSQPLRLLGMHKIKVRLTIDLIPELEVIVYREGEPIENYMIAAELLASTVAAQVAEEAEAEAELESTQSSEESEAGEEPTDEAPMDDEVVAEVASEEPADAPAEPVAEETTEKTVEETEEENASED